MNCRKRRMINLSILLIIALVTLLICIILLYKFVLSKEEGTDIDILDEEMQSIVEETKEKSKNGEDLSTNEEIISSEEEEKKVEEENIEIDAQVEQGDISYDGDVSGNGLSLLGNYQGLTYYSQLDSRWSNILYTSTNNSSQTIGSSRMWNYCRSNDC